MKITFVLPNSSLSGGIRVPAIYADRLRRSGHEVFVVSLPPRPPSLRERVKSLVKGHGWPATPVQGPSYFDDLDVPHRVLDRWRPVTDRDLPDADVVVATWWETACWVADLSPAKGAKAVLVQGYEVMPGESYPELDEAWRLPLHKIVVSQWLADLAAERFGDHDVSLVPNSVDFQQFHAPPRGKQDIPTVGMLFSIARCKGADLMIEAFERARQYRPDLRLVAFGSDSQRSWLKLPEDADYSLRPPQERIRDIYASCDVWMFGSRREGFGLPILEAMACRTPVVATPAGAACELLSGGAGTLVDHDDPQAMAEAILEISQMPDTQWRSMSEQAYQNANRYTWGDATERLEAALVRAIERKRNGELVQPSRMSA